MSKPSIKELNKKKPKLNREELGLLADHLLDNFKHRHTYYWSTYFRFLLYFIFVISSPYLVLLNVDANLYREIKSLMPYVSIFIMVACIPASLWVVFFLNREDFRLRKVHDCYKDIVLQVGIDVDVKDDQETDSIGKSMSSFLFWLVLLVSTFSVIISTVLAGWWGR